MGKVKLPNFGLFQAVLEQVDALGALLQCWQDGSFRWHLVAHSGGIWCLIDQTGAGNAELLLCRLALLELI